LKKKKNPSVSYLQILRNHPIDLRYQLNTQMNCQEVIHLDILNNEASKRKVRECDVRKKKKILAEIIYQTILWLIHMLVYLPISK
jgi:hypothetical protein